MSTSSSVRSAGLVVSMALTPSAVAAVAEPARATPGHRRPSHAGLWHHRRRRGGRSSRLGGGLDIGVVNADGCGVWGARASVPSQRLLSPRRRRASSRVWGSCGCEVWGSCVHAVARGCECAERWQPHALVAQCTCTRDMGNTRSHVGRRVTPQQPPSKGERNGRRSPDSNASTCRSVSWPNAVKPTLVTCGMCKLSCHQPPPRPLNSQCFTARATPPLHCEQRAASWYVHDLREGRRRAS